VACAEQKYQQYNQQDWAEPTLTPNNPHEQPEIIAEPEPSSQRFGLFDF